MGLPLDEDNKNMDDDEEEPVEMTEKEIMDEFDNIFNQDPQLQ